jgi:DNA-binding NtrC family response regulator
MRKIPLKRSLWTAGSGLMNDWQMQGDGVRKVHAQIFQANQTVKIAGINGEICVNGQTVAEWPLVPGDRIELGGEDWIFESNRSEAVETLPPFGEKKSIELRPVDGLLDGVIELLAEPNREHWAKKILSVAMKSMEADGGFLFEAEEDGLQLLHSHPEENDRYSHSAVEAVLKKREPLIWSMAERDHESVDLRSVEAKKIHSLLVAPLIPSGSSEMVGLLYLHRQLGSAAFTEGDLPFFQKLCRIFSIVTVGTLHLRSTRIKESENSNALPMWVGESQAMAGLRSAALRAALHKAPLMICGEIGTGRKQLARFIHAGTPAPQHAPKEPFMAWNCEGDSEKTEAALFGYTTASGRVPGLLVEAAGGTLFLGSIECLSISLQLRLAEALTRQGFSEAGSNAWISFRCRVIAGCGDTPLGVAGATSLRPELKVCWVTEELSIPPLRERGGDVLVLGRFFLEKACAEFNMNPATLTRAAEKVLLRHGWPENVRELEACLKRALVKSHSRVLDEDSLGLPQAEDSEPIYSLKAIRESAELRAVQAALSKASGNLTLAASFLGIDRKVLRDVMERLNLKKADFKGL